MQVLKQEIIQGDQPVTLRDNWAFNRMDKNVLSMVIRGTWIFREEPDPDTIKNGLRRILNYYPHLAGRLRADKEIELNNKGVPFMQGEAPELSVREVCDEAGEADRFSAMLSKRKLRRGQMAPLNVLLTKLKDGYVLGVRCSHVCLDGASFYTMIHNWGCLCRGEEIELPVLSQDLVPGASDRNKEEILAMADARNWAKLSLLRFLKILPAFTPEKLNERIGPFSFSKKALATLKEGLSRKTGLPLHTNETISTFLLKKLAVLLQFNPEKELTLVTVFNCRERIAGLPSAFAGNAVHTVTTGPVPSGLPSDEIAALLHKSLAPYLKRPSSSLEEEMTLYEDILRLKIPRLFFDPVAMHIPRPTTIYINNFCGLPVYSTNFGTGLPVRVVPHNLPDPVLIWPSPPEQEGVEVYFTGTLARAIKKTRQEKLFALE